MFARIIHELEAVKESRFSSARVIRRTREGGIGRAGFGSEGLGFGRSSIARSARATPSDDFRRAGRAVEP